MKMLKNRVATTMGAIVGKDGVKSANKVTAEYWTEHNVTLHHAFRDEKDSLEYFAWRNDQYFNYIELMPVAGFDGKSVLDFGCGPGHDLVGFGTYSRCKRLVGVDVSATSIGEARSRLALHGIAAETVLLETNSNALPYEDGTFDHIHCSGVLHHTPGPLEILKEFKRVLTPGGSVYVMVYNYNSLWVHLYVAYQRTIVEGLYPNETLREQFRHSTDGEDCPISNCYRPDEWIDICRTAGFAAKFAGAAVSMHELSMVEKRFAAIMDRRLPAESRNFLKALEFDCHLVPKFQGHYAGIDACFRLTQC